MTDADRLTLYETALRTILDSLPQYLKKEMTEKEFAVVVIGAVDNPEVFRALNGTSEGDSAAVGKALERNK